MAFSFCVFYLSVLFSFLLVSVALSVCSSFFFVSLSLSPSPLPLRVVGGGAFQPYLPNKDSLRGWAGSQAPRLPRQSVETLMMSPRSRVPQEALLTPVCDMGALGGAVQAPVWDTALRQGVGLLTTRGRAPGCHADRPPAASSAWRRDFLSIPAIDRTIF